MDFMKKKLAQQHEEELERKDTVKKQLERKVTFFQIELLQYKIICVVVFSGESPIFSGKHTYSEGYVLL